MRLRLSALFVLFAAACRAPTAPPVVIHLPDGPSYGLRAAADELIADLAASGSGPVSEAGLPAPPCTPGEIHVLLLGHAHDESGALADGGLGRQSYSIEEDRCRRNGHRIVVRGGSELAAQWGIYDFLRALGVRYLHPEQPLHPVVLLWPDEPISIEASPAFRVRSMNVHRTHPVELSAPLDATGLDMAGYQRRWIAWTVKQRQTKLGGWDAEFVGTEAFDRGYGRTTGFNLLNSQQGGRPILDPDDPRPESEQIAEAIEARLAPVDGLPDPDWFGFQFNPSEFTEADDVLTVERLRFITDYITDNHPGVKVFTINHGTAQEPTPTYGIRFFDLPELAPPELGVQVHTLMFYDLERPANVYGNADFSHLLEWTLREQAVRRIVHYPEGSWWLTFDLPVPLYLAPVTLEARQHDIDLLRGHLSETDEATTGIYGHHLFTSGQEWGYWLIDWCVARMAWDLEMTHGRCLDDFTEHLVRGAQIRAVLGEVEARQVMDMRDPELVRFLVGSDDETEVAATVGIDFHPLPPSPAEVLGWDDTAVGALRTASLEPLRAMALDYHAWADRIEAALPVQREVAAPFVREIRDGLRVFALRADHAAEVYETVLALRTALAASDLGAVDVAAEGLDRARALTEAAREVVHAREEDYRYPPELTIDGDEPGTPGAVENKTIYPYRVLSRTHRMFYWERPDDQLAALFGEGLEVVGVSQRILTEGTPLEVTLLAATVNDLRLDWGDGTVETTLAPHVYGAQGEYAWTLDATLDTGLLHHEDDAAVVERRLVFPKGSLSVDEPVGADIVEALLPGFVIGLGTDTADFMVLGQLEGSEEVAAKGSLTRQARVGMASAQADLSLDIAGVGQLTVYGAVVTVDDGTGPTGRGLTIEGEMVTGDVVTLLVDVGGFEEEGARKMVADILDYTPDTLPERVAFVITAVGHE